MDHIHQCCGQCGRSHAVGRMNESLLSGAATSHGGGGGGGGGKEQLRYIAVVRHTAAWMVLCVFRACANSSVLLVAPSCGNQTLVMALTSQTQKRREWEGIRTSRLTLPTMYLGYESEPTPRIG
eukprot:COSAG05_NODE_725_length_7716_cov_46.424314_1_plen_124_part_00